MRREQNVAIQSTARTQRLHDNTPNSSGDYRTAAQRDRDRILYSSSFRRLAEVTQVVAANSGYVFHNRLTHSLQVAQVGRRIAENLNKRQPETRDYIDPDVVEAACLAHDLGHPPFGHIAEQILNQRTKKFGGFEGNAQSFRIVTKLASRSPDYGGLDLTAATLAAILKYPWLRGRNAAKPSKWGAYSSEARDFRICLQAFAARKRAHGRGGTNGLGG
jgi:dGTPase